jgi:hypothetical protein
MPEMQKEKAEETGSKPLKKERSDRSDDQKDHKYYYDDAHGYKEFDPDADDDEFED